MPPARSTSTGYFHPLPRKLRATSPRLGRRRGQPPLDEAPACAALEADALLIAVDRDFTLRTERATKIAITPRGDLVEHVLPEQLRFFVHRALPPLRQRRLLSPKSIVR